VIIVREAIAMPFTLSLDTLFDFDSAILKADATPRSTRWPGRSARPTTRRSISSGMPTASERRSTTSVCPKRRRAGGPYVPCSARRRRIEDFVLRRGQRDPATGTQCNGLRGARLIACLQPDRFAEVTVAAPKARRHRKAMTSNNRLFR